MRAGQARSYTDASFLDPRVLTTIGNLELLARTVVQGFLSGLHRSPHLGSSLDFAEHRPYIPGDDVRRIDWRLFARTDRFYVKEYEADTNTNFVVVLDISRSMDFGSDEITKLDYARYLAASLAYLSAGQRDRVGLVTFDDDVVDYVRPGPRQFEVVLRTIDRIRPGGPGSLSIPLAKVAESFSRKSIVLLISDFYEEPTAAVRAVNWLRQRGNDLIAFHVLDPAEIHFGFEEAYSFEDLETGDTMSVVPEALWDQYRRLMADHLRSLAQLAGSQRIDYALFDTAKPLDHALFHYLSRRERRGRHGTRVSASRIR
jgi:uncharacterized protein (DUF58 family)